MKQMKRWFSLVVALATLVACSSDRDDVTENPFPSASRSGETVMISFSVEVSTDEEDTLRALGMKYGQNASGQMIPMPAYEDGEEVPVHTFLASSDGLSGYALLEWTYDKRAKKLVLSQTDGSIEVENFNNDIIDPGTNTERKWYISGLIGGEAISTPTQWFPEFHFSNRGRQLSGGRAVDDLLSFEVPYSIDWTEVSIQTGKDSTGASYLYGIVPRVLELYLNLRGQC